MTTRQIKSTYRRLESQLEDLMILHFRQAHEDIDKIHEQLGELSEAYRQQTGRLLEMDTVV